MEFYEFQFHERGTNIKFYVTENVPNTWGPLLGNVSTVLGISSDNQRLVQTDGTEMEQLPMFMEYYVTEVHIPVQGGLSLVWQGGAFPKDPKNSAGALCREISSRVGHSPAFGWAT